jgi:hypothetical protein
MPAVRHLIGPLLLIAICVPSLYASQSELDTCRALADPGERLTCYDQIGDDQIGDDQIGANAPLKPAEAQREVREGPAQKIEEAAGSPAQTAPLADGREPGWQERFGIRGRPREDGGREIRAHILSVQQSQLRNDIMTLDNGQVWMENEPSARQVSSDQAVVIREGRFSFTMVLESGRLLKVHRVH